MSVRVGGAQRTEWQLGQSIGVVFDLLSSGYSSWGEGAMRIQPSPLAQILLRLMPVGFIPAAAEIEYGSRGHATCHDQQMGLARGEVRMHQSGNVPIATVLSQQRGRVPQHEVGACGHSRAL